MKDSGGWVWDVSCGRPVYWSPGMFRICGRAAVLGPPSIDEYCALHRPAEWADWLAAIQHCIQEEAELDFSCSLLMSDGSVKNVRTTGQPLAGPRHEVTEIIGSTSELTVPAAHDLPRYQTAKAPLLPVIDLIPGLAWSAWPDGSLEYVNRVWLDYTGLTVEGAMGWGWMKAIHPDDVSRLGEYWASILAVCEPGEIEARLRRFDGAYRWFLFRAKPLRDGSGRAVKWYGSNTDIDDRKRAEEALRDSEQQLQQLVETIPALIWRRTADGQLDYLNRRHIDYLGHTAEELAGGGWIDLVDPDHRDSVAARWLESATTGTPYEDVYRLRRADGTHRWIQSVAEPFRNGEGRISHWYGLITDIDDQTRAEVALRESERTFRLIVDSIPALVCTMTPSGEVELVNQQILEYFGKSLDELRSWAFIGAVHDEDLEEVVARWRHSVETWEPYDIQHRIRRADGVYRWFHVRGLPLKDSDNRVIRWYIILTDVENGKRSEEALRASETRLRLITETIPAIVVSRDAEGKLDYVNQRLADYTGKSVQEVLDSGVDLVHPDDRDSLLRVWQTSQDSGEPYELDYRMRRNDGSYRWFRGRGSPLRDSEGRVLRWYAVINDIDDERRAREALLKSQARHSRMSQIMAVAELSASIAHEINQPLASVVANGHACVNWLLTAPPNLERAQLTAERTIRDANAASEVVKRIRALFKQARRATVVSAINDIIVEVITLIEDEVRDCGISVETNLTADLPMIVVDRVQIQQTLINLAHNAIEAMAGVTHRRKILRFNSKRVGVDLLIQVCDSGCGIAHPTSVFDPFFTTKEDGMGMGLAICRSIVEAHGGRLWADANDGAGSTFSFTLPVQKGVPA